MSTPPYLSLNHSSTLTTLQSNDYVVGFSGGEPVRIKHTDYVAQLAAILPNTGGGGSSSLLISKQLQAAYYTGDAINVTYGALGGSGSYSYFTNDPLPPGLTLSEAGALAGTLTDVGNYTIVVNVIDSNGVDNFATEIVSITSLVAVTGALGELANHAVVGGAYAASGAYSPYTFSVIGTLPPGMAVNPNGTRAGTLTTPGTYTFSVVATDSTGLTGKLVETVIVDPIVMTIVGSAGPLINGATASGAYTVTGNGTAPYTFAATGTLPPGLSVGTDGTISGTVTTNGSYDTIITVTDANGETATYTDTIVVGVLAVSNTTTDATNNAVFAGTLAISGVYVTPLAVTMSGAPSWLSAAISGATVQFSGTPGSSDTTATFNVTVTDSASQSVEVSVTLTVVAPAILVSGAMGSVYNGAAFSGAYTASGGNSPYTFSTTGTLPPGLTVASDGTRSGTATTLGTYSYTVTATDANGITGTLNESITIASAPHAEWDPTQANPTLVISNGVATNSIAGSTTGTNSGMVLSDTQITQKTYVEFLIKTPAAAIAGVGIVTSVPDFVYATDKVGDGHQQSGVYVPSGGVNQSYFVYNVTVATDGTANEYRVGMAVDPITPGYWVTFDGGTTWAVGDDGTAGDPANYGVTYHYIGP